MDKEQLEKDVLQLLEYKKAKDKSGTKTLCDKLSIPLSRDGSVSYDQLFEFSQTKGLSQRVCETVINSFTKELAGLLGALGFTKNLIDHVEMRYKP